MKKILLACGSGMCTSIAVQKRIENFLNGSGYADQYSIQLCKIAEAPAASVEYDFLIATTMAPQNLQCPYVNGVPFLIGLDASETEEDILRLMSV